MRWAKTLPTRYGVAVATSAAAALAVMAFHAPLLELSPFFLFYAAVALSSWWGGTGPGLLATALGAFAAAYLLFRPGHAAGAVAGLDELVRLVLFVLVGTLIATLNGALQQSRQRCQREAASARRSEARARRLAESNLIAVFFCDATGRVTAANDRFLALVGHTRAELEAGRINWLALTAPEHRDRDRRAMGELKACGVCTPFEKDYLLRDGRRVPVLVGCAVAEDSVDDCVGFVLDLSERKRAESELLARQERLHAMASELMLAEERERRRIATVLHDAVGQTLAAAKHRVMSLQESASRGGGGGVVGVQPLQEVYELIDLAVSRTRSLTSEISPPVLYELGLGPALEWLCDRVQSEHGIDCDFEDDRRPKPVSQVTRIVLFQAARELLANVVKHAAGARSCAIALSRRGDEVVVRVRDDGAGFDTATLRESAARTDAFGLFNIRERITHLGGRLDVRSRPGEGTAVEVSAPVRGVTDEPDEQGKGPLP